MIQATVRQITPDMAYGLLTKNTKNYRRISPTVVQRYAEVMRRGEWELNGEPITFAKDGTLLNGQHRLTAVVESGATVQMLVVTGIDNDVVTYDDGKIRSSVDIARAQGINASTRELAVSNLMCSESFDGHKFHRSSKRNIADYCGAHLNQIKQATAICGSGAVTIMRRSWAMAAIYLLLRNGEDAGMLSDFAEIVNTGLPITGRESSSAIVFRNMIYMQPSMSRKTDEPINMHYLMVAFSDFKIGLKRRNSYAIKAYTENVAETLWHKIRKEDGLE